jgi:DNA polymerase-3 subunit beta
MKIICTQENLQKNLAYLDRVVVRQTNLPILGNILFETEGGQIKLSATNLEIGITTFVGGKVLETGTVALPAKIITNFINNLPTGEVIEITTEGQKVLLKSGGYDLSVFSADGKEFPLIPKGSFNQGTKLKAQDFKRSLQSLLYAASTNVIRPELTGVYFLFEGNILKLVATDSFRLVEERVELLEKQDSIESIIIPTDTLQEVLRVIANDYDEIVFIIQDNQVFFQIGGTEITSRLINGKFPDYQQIIPSNFSDKVVFKKSDLSRSLKIAASLSSYTSGEIALVCDKTKNEFSVVSRSHDVGENINRFSFESMQGEKSVTLIFQARFLQDYLSNSAGEEVYLEYNSEYTPVLLSSVEDENLISIIMPIRK